jgi:hypothetical protein
VTAFTIPLCIASLLSSNPEIWDLGTAGVLGVLGILMKRTGYPVAPVVIGYVLAPLAERSFHSSLQSAFHSPFSFFQTPLSIGLSIAIGVGVILPVVFALKSRLGRHRDATDDWSEEAAIGSSFVENFFLSALFFVLSFVMVIWAPRYGIHESGLLPLTIGIVMLSASTVVLAGQIKKWIALRTRGRIQFLRADLRGLSRDWSTLFPTLGWTILYLVLMIVFGTHASNLIGVFLLLRLLGRLTFAKSFFWSLAVEACIFLFFMVIFEMVLWPGAIPLIIPNVLGGGDLPSFF